MIRPCVIWILILVGLGGGMNMGCIAGAHHHRINTVVGDAGNSTEVVGTVDSVDLGLVADFRVLRVALPFEGQRRQLSIDFEGGSGLTIDEVVELRTLRLDIPIWSAKQFGDTSDEQWYPGRMERRNSLELWVSGSVGLTPIDPVTATLGVVYYRYGVAAVRLYGGLSSTPYTGFDRSLGPGGQGIQRREERAIGMIGGVELTLAAGEYALELLRYILDRDREGRGATDRWNRQ